MFATVGGTVDGPAERVAVALAPPCRPFCARAWDAVPADFAERLDVGSDH